MGGVQPVSGPADLFTPGDTIVSQTAIIFFGLVGLACLLSYLWQMRSTFLPGTQKSRITRAILSGFLLNIGFTCFSLVKNYLSSNVQVSAREILSIQPVFFPLQILVTAITYGIYVIKSRLNMHMQSFEDEIGKKHS